MRQASGTFENHRSRFQELILAHGKLFFQLAYGILRQAEPAEEVCQRALTIAWERRETMGDPSNLRGWVARIVINESLQAVRRNKREQKMRSIWARGVSRVESNPDPGLRAAVLKAVGNLTEPLQIVVILRIMHGMSGNEVSQLVGCSAGEVSRRLYKGMEQLRLVLADTVAAREFGCES